LIAVKNPLIGGRYGHGLESAMPKNEHLPGPSDIGYINLPSEAERHYWAREFGCSQEQLMDAVAAVGPLVVDVRSHLGSRLEPRGPDKTPTGPEDRKDR